MWHYAERPRRGPLIFSFQPMMGDVSALFRECQFAYGLGRKRPEEHKMRGSAGVKLVI